MASAVIRLRPLITPPTVRHTASLIFLHGSGDTGDGVRTWLQMASGRQEFNFPHIRIIYPTATPKPYTPFGGLPSSVWFDRAQISPFSDENIDSVDLSCQDVDELVNEEVKAGIPRERIVVGGFSMGGALAMHYSYGLGVDLPGVFVLSSFLNEDSAVYERLAGHSGDLPVLFQCHGGRDPLVKEEWGRVTHDRLISCGVQGEYHTFPNMFHEMKRAELDKLNDWIMNTLPDT